MENKLVIPCSKSNLASVRDFVTDVLASHNLSEMETYKIVLAIDEICANLIIHSNECNDHESLEVEINYREGINIEFLIKDKGTSFDINRYEEPSMKEIIASKRKGGIGLMLVKRIMDEIEFTTENNYNICRLIKRLQ